MSENNEVSETEPAPPPADQLGELFASMLGDTEVRDVELKGIDDEATVGALKAVLAAWSCVFRRMFFGHFSEAKSSVVNVAYEKQVVEWLVEFCYRVKIESFESTRDLEDSHQTTITEELIGSALSLSEAAGYYQISQLERYIDEWFLSVMFSNAWVACFVFETTLEDSPHKDLAFTHIISNLENVPMEEKELRYLSNESMKRIVRHRNVCASELYIFKCIQMWASVDSVQEKEIISEEAAEASLSRKRTRLQDQPSPRNARWSSALELAKSIDLTRISPPDLSSIVKTSGLVSSDDLCAAYERHIEKMAHCHAHFFLEDLCMMPRSQYVADFVFEVTVQGAGVPEANGAYAAIEFFNGCPVYCKEGIWNSDERTFLLYNDLDRWHIGVFPRRTGVGDVNPECVPYTAAELSTKQVPTGTWRAEHRSWRPAPTVQLGYHD